METILDGLSVTIRDGKCNVWRVSPYEVKIRIGDPGCIEIIFRTEWEKGRFKSESIYRAQAPITEEARNVCFVMVFEGLYPKGAKVGLVNCEDSEILTNENEVFWAKEMKNGKILRGWI